MVKFVMVSLEKEMYDGIVKQVGTEKIYFISDFVKKLVIEFFRSPHELDIEEKRIKTAYIKLQLRLPKDVYEKLKEYANSHGSGLANVVRAIISERLGMRARRNGEENKKKARKSEGGMVTVTFKLEKEILQKLDLMAINSRRTRSTLIRQAVMLLVDGGHGAAISEQNGCTLLTREL